MSCAAAAPKAAASSPPDVRARAIASRSLAGIKTQAAPSSPPDVRTRAIAGRGLADRSLAGIKAQAAPSSPPDARTLDIAGRELADRSLAGIKVRAAPSSPPDVRARAIASRELAGRSLGGIKAQAAPSSPPDARTLDIAGRELAGCGFAGTDAQAAPSPPPQLERSERGMSVTSAGFPKEHRLLASADFGAVFNQSHYRVSCQCFRLIATRNDHDHGRLGLAIAKKAIPKAAWRNRIKRLARESFRLHGDLAGLDIVVLARPQARELPNAQVRTRLDTLFSDLAAKRDRRPRPGNR